MFDLQSDVKFVSYNGAPIDTKNMIIRTWDDDVYCNNTLIQQIIKRRDRRSERRLKHSLKQVDRFVSRRPRVPRVPRVPRTQTLVQIRNTHEGNIIMEYVKRNYEQHGVQSSLERSSTLTQNIVTNMTVRLPDDSGCSKSECSCARYHFTVKSKKVPVMYVLLRFIKDINLKP